MTTNLPITRYGDDAWLIAVGSHKPVALAAAIRQRCLADDSLAAAVSEVVPGANAVLVVANSATGKTGESPNNLPSQLSSLLTQVDLEAAPSAHPNLVTLEVDYDGADLISLADKLDLSVEALIRLHTEPTYEVAFCGFAPGFAYLSGLNPRLHVQRLATPRPQVPAGSVAIADSYSAVYPQSSPGGWHLLGRTGANLFDIIRPDPALLQPGTQVRFVPLSFETNQATHEVLG